MAKRKIYKSVEQLQEDLQAQWLERIDFYKKKYPHLDYDLEVQSMQEWIEKDYNKAKKYHVWNLFIQRWLGRCKPNYKSRYIKPADEEQRTYEFYKKLIEENPNDIYNVSLYAKKVKEYEDKYGKMED